MGDCQDPLLGNEDAATDVPTGLTLQGALPGPPSRATRPAPEDPLVHSGSRAAPTVYQGAGEAELCVTHPQTQPDAVTCKGSFFPPEPTQLNEVYTPLGHHSLSHLV